jgi:O-antigen/teichoic acid export membrane protein
MASAEPAAPAPADGIRGRVLRGVAWKGTSQLFLQVSRAAVAVVLARLLAPHDFGIAAMVLVFSSLVLVFSDLALGAALVQRKVVGEAEYATVFWTSLAAGLVFALLGIASSGPVARFYHEPAVRSLVVVLSLGFLVAAAGVVPTALLTRSMDFRALEVRAMIATSVGAAAGIALAVAGFGPWAIIALQLATTAMQSALVWVRSPWRPSTQFSFRTLRELVGFSGNVFGQRLLYYLHRNTDNLLVGRFLGAAALGAYGLAYNVMLVPFTRIAGPIQEVVFPAFSRMQDDRERLAAGWIRVTRIVAAVSMPALLGLLVLAPDFVTVVLGQKWHSVVPVLQILTWVGLIQALQSQNASILLALDRTRTLFRFSIFFFASHLTAFLIGVHFGIVGVAVAYAISTTIVEPPYGWLTARALGISPLRFVRSLVGVTQASLAMLAFLFAGRALLVHEGVPPVLRLLALTVAGACVFLAASAWRAPELAAEARRLLRRGPAEPVGAQA